MSLIEPAPTPARHECDQPYPYLFTDELPNYRPPSEDDDEEFPWHTLPGRSVSIDNPRHEDGTLWQCSGCGTWWEYHRNATPPGQYGGMVQCITTYKPSWEPVRWWHFSARRRIKEHT